MLWWCLTHLAGLLLEGLISPPLCAPPNEVIDGLQWGQDTESDFRRVQQQDMDPALSLNDGTPNRLSLHLDPASGQAQQQQQLHHHHQHQAAASTTATATAAPLWLMAAHGSLYGFGRTSMHAEEVAEGGGLGCPHGPVNAEQADASLRTTMLRPTEEGYREWGATFTNSFLTYSSVCCFIRTLIGTARVVAHGNFFQIACHLPCLLPYITHFRQPKVCSMA